MVTLGATMGILKWGSLSCAYTSDERFDHIPVDGCDG